MKRKLSALGIYLASLGLVACSESEDEGSGTLSVLLESEDTIIDGLDPGDRTENIRDGWRVRYDKYIVAVGDIGDHSPQPVGTNRAGGIDQQCRSDLDDEPPDESGREA